MDSPRKKILDEAAKCVLQDRNTSYGGPEKSFELVARLWSEILGVKVTTHQVALCMVQLKVARLVANPTHHDSKVDGAGYFACMAEFDPAPTTAKPIERLDKWVFERNEQGKWVSTVNSPPWKYLETVKGILLGQEPESAIDPLPVVVVLVDGGYFDRIHVEKTGRTGFNGATEVSITTDSGFAAKRSLPLIISPKVKG